jgi:hypothetical protein
VLSARALEGGVRVVELGVVVGEVSMMGPSG